MTMPIMGLKELNIDKPYHSQGLKEKKKKSPEKNEEMRENSRNFLKEADLIVVI